MKRTVLVCGVALAVLGLGAARSGATTSKAQLKVVAAENFWGSIATQLGGNRVHVTSIIHSPGTDPHSYEPTAADARVLAGAQMAIVNGVGYDPWADKLIAANPVHGRAVLKVGDLVGVKPGGNPHRWYSPGDVQKVIAEITRDYVKLDPKDASYFAQQKASFKTKGLAQYETLIAMIKRKYAGVPVGASESIFAPLADALKLKLLTPPSFLKAISEGNDPTPRDKTSVDRQISKHLIKVWVFNSQNSTPDVARLTSAARKAGIPVTTITETLTPASATFQEWQSRQLEALAKALAQATKK